jgi:hypothetical protein
MIYTDAFILYEYHGNNGFWVTLGLVVVVYQG